MRQAEMQEMGKGLVFFGGVLMLCGAVMLLAPKIPGIGKLPGDFYIRKNTMTFYPPAQKTPCMHGDECANSHFSSPIRNALAEAVVQMGFFICTPGVVFCALLKRGRKTLDATPCVQSGFLIDSPNR